MSDTGAAKSSKRRRKSGYPSGGGSSSDPAKVMAETAQTRRRFADKAASAAIRLSTAMDLEYELNIAIPLPTSSELHLLKTPTIIGLCKDLKCSKVDIDAAMLSSQYRAEGAVRLCQKRMGELEVEEHEERQKFALIIKMEADLKEQKVPMKNLAYNENEATPTAAEQSNSFEEFLSASSLENSRHLSVPAFRQICQQALYVDIPHHKPSEEAILAQRKKISAQERECVKECIQQSSDTIGPADMSDIDETAQNLASSSSRNPSPGPSSRGAPAADQTELPALKRPPLWTYNSKELKAGKDNWRTRPLGLSVAKMMEKDGTGIPKIQMHFPLTRASKKMRLQIDEPNADHDDLKYRITEREMAEEKLVEL